MKIVTVGPIVGRLGEKVSGFLDVPAASDAATRIPVSVITGTTSGPVLALVAGTHGSEPSPIVALQRVREELKPAELNAVMIDWLRRRFA